MHNFPILHFNYLIDTLICYSRPLNKNHHNLKGWLVTDWINRIALVVFGLYAIYCIFIEESWWGKLFFILPLSASLIYQIVPALAQLQIFKIYAQTVIILYFVLLTYNIYLFYHDKTQAGKVFWVITIIYFTGPATMYS
jgi:hypothetical protein